MTVFLIPAILLFALGLILYGLDGQRGSGWELVSLFCLFLSLALVFASVVASLMLLFRMEVGL